MSKISKHLNEVFDSLGTRKRKGVLHMMDGQVIQANNDGFTDVMTYVEAARIAGVTIGILQGYIRAGVIRRVMLPGRTHAVGLNVEDVRKLIVSLGTTVTTSEAATMLGCTQARVYWLISHGRLVESKIAGNSRRRVTVTSLADEMNLRGFKWPITVGFNSLDAKIEEQRKGRPDDDLVRALAENIRTRLEIRRMKYD